MERCRFPSPLGTLTCEAEDGMVTALYWEDGALPSEIGSDLFRNVGSQLSAYFSGGLQRFDLPLLPKGTPFQRKVWDLLLEIPFGTSIGYRELAQRYGDLKAIRAIAAANGKNPVSLIIPCHRVIGSDGSLVGYAGGLERKQWLLAHESGTEQLELF